MKKVEKTKTLKFKYVNGMTDAGKEKYSSNTITGVPTAISDDIAYGMLELIKKVQKTESTQVEISQSAVLQ